jgi:hypothetical protein
MICDERRIVKRSGTGERLRNTFRYRFDLSNGNLTRIHNTDGGGEDYNMEFDALNRLVRYYEDTAGEKEIFSYNCAGLLAAREEDGDITKFGYDVYSVLDMITKANGDELGFDFDMLRRLRGYDTDTRESTFNYDGTKRFGDFDDGWKRYHWCKSQFLGYEDEANTYYIVPDINGSTKVIFTHAGTIVNRLDYDTLGKIRNQDTTPQVELLWRGWYYTPLNCYICEMDIYDPVIGTFIIPIPRSNDSKLLSLTPWILLFFGTMAITYALDLCRQALTERLVLHHEFEIMSNIIDPSIRDAQASMWGYGSYSSWRADWNVRSNRNIHDIHTKCKGLGI